MMYMSTVQSNRNKGPSYRKKLVIAYLLSEIYACFLSNSVNVNNNVTSNAHVNININIHVSASSIPRSTNAHSRTYSQYMSSSDGDDGSHNNSNNNDHNNDDHNDLTNDDYPAHHSKKQPQQEYNAQHHNQPLPPWNASPNIDPDGFITNSYHRIPGEWESEANIGGKHLQLENNVLIRQVPGDGNCLFHSITVALALLVNSTHIDMVGRTRTRTRMISNNKKRKRKKCKSSTHTNVSPSSSSSQTAIYDLKHLYTHSQYLREKAVDVLSHNPRRLLFLQGNEYLRARDLVNAAAAQYNLTGQEYCDLMRKESYWGGGPEIVALCNYLKRPIYVYELCSDDDDLDSEEEGVDMDVDVSGEEENGDCVTTGRVENEEDGQGFQDLKNDNLENSLVNDESGDVKVELDSVITASSNSGSGSRTSTSSNLDIIHQPNKRLRKGGERQLPTNTQFRLRRMACFGSPKFDRKEPIHILSADSRFPDVKPGKQLSSGNHFMTLFPEELIQAVHKENMRIQRKRKSAGVRGGGSVGIAIGESMTMGTSLYEQDLDWKDAAMERPRRRRKRKLRKVHPKQRSSRSKRRKARVLSPDSDTDVGIGGVFGSICRTIVRWMSSL